jgi:folate-dependent phosphoribosylglycinamide formyltransferase PurN
MHQGSLCKGYLVVGGFRLLKVLKNMINNVFPSVIYIYRSLRNRNEVVHNTKSMVGTKVITSSKDMRKEASAQ